MNISGWFQLALYLVLLILITKPLGLFLFQVLDANGKTFLDPVIKPFERLTYRIFGVNPEKEQGWIPYTISMLLFELVTVLFTYLILRFQNFLPLNPQGQAGVTDHLAFNTAWSFATNTNWQSYGGENTMTYLSQMLALASHNFFSAAVGIAIAAAVIRGIARNRVGTIGNFWRDLIRLHLYLLLPICIVYALFLVSQGVIQNFNPYTTISAIDQSGATASQPIQQIIAQGPVASQIAIKMLGT